MSKTNPQHADRAHSKYSASGMASFRRCPLKILTEKGCPELPTKPHAIQGTHAHEVSEIYLLAHMEGKPEPKDSDILRHSKYDDEMVIHAKGYRDWVESKIGELRQYPHYWAIEERFHITTNPDRGGTADFVFAYKCPIDNVYKAFIIDYKYGEGVRVISDENDQLFEYMRGLYLKFKEYGEEIKHFTGCIYQPRAKDIDEEDPKWICSEYSLEDIKPYWESMDKLVELSEGWFDKYEDIEEVPDRILEEFQVADRDYQCRWCKGSGKCRAYKTKYIGDILGKFKSYFKDLESMSKISKESILKDYKKLSASLTEDEKAFICKFSKEIKDWVDAVPRAIMSDFANNKPNQYLKMIEVDPRSSWMSTDTEEDELELINGLKDLGIDDPIRIKKSVITIGTAEKLVEGGRSAIQHLLKKQKPVYKLVDRGHPAQEVTFGVDSKQMFKDSMKEIIKKKT